MTELLKGYLAKGKCEVGIHVHAWNNPPLYYLDAKYNGNPYLIEYPVAGIPREVNESI